MKQPPTSVNGTAQYPQGGIPMPQADQEAVAQGGENEAQATGLTPVTQEDRGIANAPAAVPSTPSEPILNIASPQLKGLLTEARKFDNVKDFIKAAETKSPSSLGITKDTATKLLAPAQGKESAVQILTSFYKQAHATK